ncbi:MAG: dihydroorotase [Kiritimatiellae bacterium]|nr:dihydroorotase [Kiritimatiellia bacterium]MDD4735476.1 dihydroorotase [Kiritimatiellia bacterium]
MKNTEPIRELLLRNVRILDPASNREVTGDLYAADDGCLRSPPRVPPASCQVLNRPGWIVCPALTDVHVHLREPGHEAAETIDSGTRAAARGGFSRVVAMPNTSPALDHPDILRAMLAKAENAPCEVLASGCLSLGRLGRQPVDFDALKEAGVVAFTDDGSTPASAELMLAAAHAAARLNIPIMDHAEDSSLPVKGVMHEGAYSARAGLPGIPAAAEVNIVRRDIELAERTGCRMHIQHLSARESIELIRDAQARGLPVTAEATPHHLALADDDVDPNNPSFKMNPPLRSADDRRALREAVAEGIVSILATDHAPHTAEAKRKGFLQAPFGIIGLETAVAVTYEILVKSGLLSALEWVRRWTITPNELIQRPAPTLTIGEPANLVLINPNANWTVRAEDFASRSTNTPFIGWNLSARPMLTIHRGCITSNQSGFPAPN